VIVKKKVIFTHSIKKSLYFIHENMTTYKEYRKQ